MLKRIDPGDVVLGMFIHKLEGNWFSHPFWSAQFLLTDQGMLDRLHASRVPAVIIDTERGIDPDAPAPHIAPASAAPARRPAPAPPRPLRQVAPIAPPPPALARTAMTQVMSAPPAEVARGFGRANAVAERGLKVVTHAFLEMRLGKAITPATISPVIDSIIASVKNNPFAFNGLMRFRRVSEDVYRHALATSALMIALGRNLNLSPPDLHAAGLAGLLLDAGVCLLPMDEHDHVTDPRSLPHEIWRSHVRLGHEFILRSRLSDTIARACLEHHERIDGAGWPHGTGGQALSKLGRMAAICDAYDQLASGSEGRPGCDPAEALRRMKDDHGAYDPELLAVFETTVGIWPTGSLVALRSGRLAVVIEQNRDTPDRPLIAVFYAPDTAQAIDATWIDLDTCYGADAIAGPGAIASLPHACQPAASAALAAALERVAPFAKGKPSKAA
jgi:HD-GYP domain-containing protein (c-di-GMP phosphodiesterase class II)